MEDFHQQIQVVEVKDSMVAEEAEDVVEVVVVEEVVVAGVMAVEVAEDFMEALKSMFHKDKSCVLTRKNQVDVLKPIVHFITQKVRTIRNPCPVVQVVYFLQELIQEIQESIQVIQDQTRLVTKDNQGPANLVINVIISPKEHAHFYTLHNNHHLQYK